MGVFFLNTVYKGSNLFSSTLVGTDAPVVLEIAL